MVTGAGSIGNRRLLLAPAGGGTVRPWAEAEKFDAVVCYCSGMFRYTLLPELADVPYWSIWSTSTAKNGSTVLVARSVAKQWLYELESARVWKLEGEIAERAATVTLVSEEERELFRRVGCSVVGPGGRQWCRSGSTSRRKRIRPPLRLTLVVSSAC